MWPPVFVIPTGSLCVFFPGVVFEHPKSDFLFFSTNHLIANVVRNDGHLDLDVAVVAVEFRESGNLLCLPLGALSSR